jgi:hypothetical protein
VGDRKHLPAMKKAGPGSGRKASGAITLAVSFLVSVLIAGCANQIVEPEPSDPTSGETTVSDSPSPATDLTIVFDDGSGSAKTWQLTCDPAGGTHPDPEAACRVLETNGAAALPPVPKDKACTQIYGGPETATITGTWQGNQVTSRFARNDGCQISRWKLMEGLLPRGGS